MFAHKIKTKINKINYPFLEILFLICLLLFVFLIIKIPSRFDTTHLSNDMVEMPVEISPLSFEEFVYYPEAPFVLLKIRMSGESKAKIGIKLIDDNNEIIIYEKIDTSLAVINTQYGARELTFLDSDKRYTGTEYRLIVENLDYDESIYILTVFDDPNRVSLYSEDKSVVGKVVASLCFLISLIYLIVMYTLTRRSISVESFYVVSAIFLSIIYLFMYLPQDCPDSESHFPAIYRLSNLLLGYSEEEEWNIRFQDLNLMSNFVHRTVITPASYDKYIFGLESNFDNKMMISSVAEQDRMKFYSVLSYFPQVLGFSFGRALNFNGYICVLLARLFMMSFYISGCFWAIRIVPLNKKLYSFICLLPFSLLLSSALSYDGVLFAISSLFTAYSFKYAYEKKNQHLIWLCVFMFLLGAIKGGSGLMLAPLLFLKCNRNADFKRLIPIAFGVVSIYIFDFVLPQDSFFQLGGDERMLEASFALYHPLKYAKMMMTTYLSSVGELVFSKLYYRQNHFVIEGMPSNLIEVALARNKYYFSMFVYTLTPIIYCVLFFTMICKRKEDRSDFVLSRHNLIIIFSTLLMYYFLTPVMLLSSTLKNSGSIAGIQGRYYLIVFFIEIIILEWFYNHIIRRINTKKRIILLNNDVSIYRMFSLASVFVICCSMCINFL